jgi:hypothetical protein
MQVLYESEVKRILKNKVRNYNTIIEKLTKKSISNTSKSNESNMEMKKVALYEGIQLLFGLIISRVITILESSTGSMGVG